MNNVPYQLRLTSSLSFRNASEIQRDLFDTMNRIRGLVRNGSEFELKLAEALTWSVNRMRDEITNGETRN